MTEIDGLDIHFIHVRSQHGDALPLIMTHGWPGSVIELLDTVGPLTDPTAHGGDAEDAFHLVLPSLPGDFWTLTCINWLRTEPYIPAWSQAYRNDRLVVIGVHTPEFSSKHQIGRVRQATKERGIDYPSRSTTTTQFGAPSTPLLAGAVLRRRARHHRRPPPRRRTLRAIRARHPAAARRRERARLRRRARRTDRRARLPALKEL
jgi:Epoxide hydrolase N terminus